MYFQSASECTIKLEAKYYIPKFKLDNIHIKALLYLQQIKERKKEIFYEYMYKAE